ncbi:hypothetical protein R3P38DRAFT_3190321 [Favolaschia claudopus]|uniref:Uncharacterized protein n=1 Tax=Favolaschia claudopus TaxID=2862362 RepID=A0AAW0BQR9_9AGAR
MLILLALFVLENNGVLSSPLARAVDDTCIDIHKCRTLYGIVWSCITTIFACIWVSVHPNMPPLPIENTSPQKKRGRLHWLVHLWHETSGIRRRLKMMLVALIAPEIMVGFAVRQWLSAHTISRKYRVSLTHGFFYSMGGFVDEEGQPIITEDRLIAAIDAVRAVPVSDIQDKSKRDALAKLVAVAQILRVIGQSITRLKQQLAITLLEIATVAYAVVTIFIWLFWMNKPLDAQKPIIIQLLVPQGSPPPPSMTREAQTSTVNLPSMPSWIPPTVRRFIAVSLGAYDLNYDGKHIPAFFSPLSQSSSRLHQIIALFVQCIFAFIFGGIHCMAWNTVFPTIFEKWAWRSCAVAVTVAPSAGFSFGVSKVADRFGTHVPDWLKTIIVAWFYLSIPIYLISRDFLLVLPFTALRSVHSDVFCEVEWGKYIPHL